MAAPTKPAGVKKVLANPEPSTHGTNRKCRDVRFVAAPGAWADVTPRRTSRASFQSVAWGRSSCLSIERIAEERIASLVQVPAPRQLGRGGAGVHATGTDETVVPAATFGLAELTAATSERRVTS